MFPSKLVAERLTIEFNFLDLIDEPGESITSNFCTVEVLSGIDTNPNQIFYGFATHVGLVVTQQIQLGQPGVIYKITCTAISSTGQTYQKLGLLAVLPTDAIAPPLFGEIYTTTIYPMEVLEGVDTLGEAVSGVLRSFFMPSTIEAADVAAFARFGQLRTANVVYVSPPEAVDVAAIPTTGILKVAQIVYVAPFEAVDVAAQPTTGTLAVKLIRYLNWPAEAVDVTAAPTTGTLA